MFASLSIRTKITLVVSFLLLAMSAMGALAIKQMYTINGATSDIVTSWLPSVRALGEVRAATISYRSVVRGHLLATDAADTKVQDDTLVRYAEMLDKARKSYEPMISSPEERAMYSEFSKLWSEYIAALQPVLALSRKNARDEARDMNVKVNQIGFKADEALQKDVELNNKGALTAGELATDSFGVAIKMVIGSLLFAIVVGVGAAILLVRDVSAGITSIVLPMQALGTGIDDRRDRGDGVVGIDRTGSLGRYADRHGGALAGIDHDSCRSLRRSRDQCAVGRIRHRGNVVVGARDQPPGAGRRAHCQRGGCAG
jgi:methyl-accepting chemotaxis protein